MVEGKRLRITGGAGTAAADPDALAMIYQRLDEDGQIIVRLLEPGGVDGDRRPLAGLLLRDGLSPDAAFLALLAGHERSWLMYRDSPGRWPDLQWPDVQLPAWLKLKRRGGQVSALTSADGLEWRELVRVSMRATAPLYAGFTVIETQGEQNTPLIEDLRVKHQPFAPHQEAGVELIDGSFLPGAIEVTDSGVRLQSPDGSQQVFEASRIARLVFRPLEAEVVAELPAGTGARLRSGDFQEAQVRGMRSDNVMVNSLIFGPQRLELRTIDVLVLREAPPPAGWQLSLADGTRLRAESVQLKTGQVIIERDGERSTFPVDAIQQLRAFDD
jgi:hypothetical protein